MEDWNKLIEEDEANNNYDNDNYDDYEDEYFELPSPTIINLNDDGTLQKEISYRWNDDSTKIIRTETTFKIVNATQQISQAAINRRKYWIKFGAVRSVPKGQIEHNITTERQTGQPDGINIFLWTDKDGNIQKPKKQPQQSLHQQNNKRPRPQIQQDDDSKDDIKSNNDNVSQQSSNRYIPPWKRMDNDNGSEYGDEESVDIRITNLPQWTKRENVKELINAFYKQYINRFPPRGYKIKMTPSEYTLQRWKEEGNTQRLEEYDVGAFVEFKNEKYADMAVEILNGHRYEYCVLYVEKAKPKNSGSGKGNNNYQSKFHSRSR